MHYEYQYVIGIIIEEISCILLVSIHMGSNFALCGCIISEEENSN